MSNEPTQKTPKANWTPAENHDSEAPRSSMKGAIIAGVAGALAGLLAHFTILGIGEIYRIPPEIEALNVGIPSGEDQQKISASRQEQYYKNSVVWMAAAGGMLGILLGATRRRPLLASACGGVVGAIVASGAGPLAIWMDQTAQANVPAGELTVPEHYIIAMHAATWLVVGIAVGLGVGLAALERKGRTALQSAVVGGIAGMLGGALFPIVAALLVPSVNTSFPIPEMEAVAGRILWMCLPMTLIGLAVGRIGLAPKPATK